MSDHPIDQGDVLISLVNAALTAAEADAAAPDSGLIFRPEWRPELRTRSSTSGPQGKPGANRSSSWLSHIKNQLSRSGLLLQQDQPHLLPGLPAKPTPPSASTSGPPPRAASEPASPLPRRLPPPPSQLQEDAVAELLKKNKDVFDEVINHPFPQTLGKGTASLDGFRYYMIQDKLYLETCARLKMNAVAASPNFEDVETFEFRHKSSIEYVKKLKEICITMLGIPESTIKTTPRSVELDASERFYKDSLRNEDALLGYYVVLLPCVLTYWRIAERLMNDPSTAKNVVYHPAWIVVNYDPSSVGKYTKFINENIAAKGGLDRWNYIFRIACQLEAKLFNTGLQSPTPFQIIPDGTYSIQVSSVESVVLAIQNVKGLLRPPLDKLLGGYFPTDAGLSVVGTEKTGLDNERWRIVATKAGYTFQNSGTGLYLGIYTASDRKECRVLQPVLEPYYWWINPVSSHADQGSLVYQIYDSANLRYTLHADMEVLKSIGSTDFCYTPIIAYENSEASCQMWSFNDKSEQLEHAQIGPDEQIGAEYPDAEIVKQLQKAQAMNAEFEAERAIYMRENSLLRQELEKVRLANLGAQAAKDEALKELEVERTKIQEEMAKWEEQKKALANGQSVASPFPADKWEKADPASPSNIIIAIMGPTGSGKTSFIRLLTGDKSIEIGQSVESATSEIGHYKYFHEGGRCVTFVDSPGFDDSREGVTDTDVLLEIAAFLELEFDYDKKLSGIIYFHRITDTRMGGVSRRNLRMFRKLCGDDALKNVVVVTSRWDDVQGKDRDAMGKREKELMETPGKFFAPLITAGGRFLRYDNTAESARRIMEVFLKNDPILLDLQIQPDFPGGKMLHNTAANSELEAEMKKLMDKHSTEMKALKEEMARVIAANDGALKKELEAERIKMQQEMKKWEEQKKVLADGLAAAREETKKRQEEADRKLRAQRRY